MKNPELLREGLARQCYPKMAVFEPRPKWLAKAFGFQRDLCHGMWALAKSLNYIAVDNTQPIRCDVAFKGPLYIENDITVKVDANAAGRFELFSGKNDRPCIASSIHNVPVGTHL